MSVVMDGIKLFSVAQAERALPLVQRILDDVILAVAKHARLTKRRLLFRAHPNPGSRTEDEIFRIEREISEAERDLVRYQDELAAIGVELKDAELGLVDFYSRYGDQVVYLCWRCDEKQRITYWHRLDGGYRGRQVITDEIRDQFQGSS